MPEQFQFNERPDSRAWTTDPPSVTYRFKASGEHDDGIVRAYALTGTPLVVYSDVAGQAPPGCLGGPPGPPGP